MNACVLFISAFQGKKVIGLRKFLPLRLFCGINNRRDLGHQIVNILKHCAFCRSKAARPVDMPHHGLILGLYLIKISAQSRKRPSGFLDNSGNF
jgi:hypothetical protein